RGQVARPRMRVVLPMLAVLLVVSIVVSAAFGPAPIAMPDAVRIVAAHAASAFGGADAFAAVSGDDSIEWLIRMPRALLAALSEAEQVQLSELLGKLLAGLKGAAADA
ncbi:hypothetical protein M3570_21235, partial [Bacillus subtilis]|nr:hypothetical protein [Bacillus subtilis]